MESKGDSNTLLSELNNKKVTEYLPVIMFVVFTMIFGIFGNISVIAYYGFKTKTTSPNLFIVALAIIDLITCFYFGIEIVELCYSVTFRSSAGCKIMNFVYRCLLYTSGCFLLLIAIDRYRIICRQKLWKVTARSAKLAILSCSLFCCLLSVKELFVSDTITVNLTIICCNQSVTGYYCAYLKEKNMESTVYSTQTIDLVVFLIIISSLIISYSFVAREVCKHRIKRQVITSNTCTSKEAEVESEISVISYEHSTKKYKSPLTNPITETSLTNPSNSSVLGDREDTGQNHTKVTNTSAISIIDVTDKNCGLNNKGMNNNNSATIFRSENNIGQNYSKKIERNITVMMIIMTVASILSYVPHFVLDLLLKSKSDTFYHQEFNAGLQIVWRSFILNSAINPYIMGLFNTKFRKFVKDVCKSFAVNLTARLLYRNL